MKNTLLLSLLLVVLLLFVGVFVCNVCGCVHACHVAQVEVTEQLCGVDGLLPPLCGSGN